MIVQIRSFEDHEIQALLASTGMKTAASAFSFAARQFPHFCSQIDKLSITVSDQHAEIRRLRQIIEAARFAAAALVDKTSQQDLDL